MAAAGVMPHDALDYTARMLNAAIDGAAERQRIAMALGLWTAHHGEGLARTKRLPDLAVMLRKLQPGGGAPMSPKEQHSAIMQMARAMGARVVHKKKGDP